MATRAAYYGTKPALDAANPAAPVADVGALTAAASAAVPTKIEFDKVVVDLATLRTKVNDLLAKLRTAGLLDT